MAYLNGPHNHSVTADQVKDKTWDGRRMLARPRYCDSVCSESLREDRRSGLVHPAELVEFDDGSTARLGVELASRFTRHCAYCGRCTLK